MDPTLYKAAMEGNITGYGDFIVADHLQRDEENGYQVTAKAGNTILHVAAIYGHTHFVKEVLKISPRLLYHRNKIRKETALHIAAKEGHARVVRELVETAGKDKQKLMRMADDKGDTALHKAVWSGYLDVVKILVKEDPEYEFPSNSVGKTPLYLAAESGFDDILVEILESGTEQNYSALRSSSQTPLHAAVIQGHTDCARSLLKWNKSLCEKADNIGWIPLHYAVEKGLKEVVSDMLGWNKSLAYIPAGNTNSNSWTTTLNIAARKGHVNVINEISEHCPDCWEMVNSRGQNVLHVAISNKQENVVKFLLESKNCHFLVDEPNNSGEMPIDLLAYPHRSSLPLEIMWHPRAKKMALNKKNQNLVDIAPSCAGASKKELSEEKLGSIDQLGMSDSNPKFEKRIDNVMKAIQMYLVVATLVMVLTAMQPLIKGWLF